MFHWHVGHTAVVLFALSAVGIREVAAQQGHAPPARASAECSGCRGAREADLVRARSTIVFRPAPGPGLLRPSVLLGSAADTQARSPLPAGAGFGTLQTLRPALTPEWIQQPSAARRKPVWRYLALGAGIGGLSGGLLGWLAGEGMRGGTHGDMRCGHCNTQTAVAVGIAGGAAFGTLVGLVVYALDGSDTTSP